MTSKQIRTLILTLIIANKLLYASAPPLKDWQKCLGGSSQDIPGSIIRCHDGSIALIGSVDSQNGDVTFNHGSTDIWLSKIDASGNLIWQKSIGGTSIDVGSSICELPNGNLVIAGYSSSIDGDISNNKGHFDVILACTDSIGNIIWFKNFGGTQVDLCYSMIRSSDGGFILGGGSYSDDIDVSGHHGNQDFWVLKTDSAGNLLWQHSAGGSDIDVCYAIAEDAAGNIYSAGATNSTDGDITYTHGNFDQWVIKFNASGNILWKKTYGGSGYETAQSILIDSQQRVLIGGYTRSNNGDVTSNYGLGDSWLIQLNSQGGLVYEKTYGGTNGDNLFSIVQASDGGYLLTSGSTSSDFDISSSLGQEDVWIVKTDISFQIEWSKNYGGSNNERPVSVLKNTDGGFTIASYTFSNDKDVSGLQGTSDIWLLNLSCKTPVAFFSTPSVTCLGDTITVANTSVNASQVNWNFNSTIFSTEDTLQIITSAAGFFNLTLSAQTCYSTSYYSAPIEIFDCNLPQIRFNALSNTVCAKSQVTFADSSVNATGWSWTFPGGNPAASTLSNPVVTYNQPGVYSVMLTVSNNYGSQTSLKLNYITVHALPAAPIITANGNQFISSPASQYQWFLNNTSIPSANAQNFSAANDGYYTVMVVDNNNCSNISDPLYYSMTSIRENKTDNFSVFPNPAVNELKIMLPPNFKGAAALYNISGQKLFEKKIESEREFQIDLSQYAGGLYKIVFTNNINNKINQISINKY